MVWGEIDVPQRCQDVGIHGKDFVTDFSYYAVTEAAMELRGLKAGYPCRPFVGKGDGDKKELREVLKKIRILGH
jgi:dihydrodipicolinate synthase/N-acetylneuraminate lyase